MLRQAGEDGGKAKMTVKSSRVSLYGCLNEQVRPSSSSLARHFLLRMPLAFGFLPLRVRLDVRGRPAVAHC